MSKLFYEGGSLRAPTEGLLIEEKENGDEVILVTFRTPAFNHDYSFRDDMIAAVIATLQNPGGGHLA